MAIWLLSWCAMVVALAPITATDGENVIPLKLGPVHNAFPEAIHSLTDRLYVSRALQRLPWTFREVNASNLLTMMQQEMPESSQCDTDLIDFFFALLSEKAWALTMLDAFGKPGSGITEGNLIWAGSYTTCLDVQVPGNNPNAQYCWAKFQLTKEAMAMVGLNNLSLAVSLQTAICMPAVCSESDLDKLITSALGSKWLQMASKFVNFTNVDCVPLERHFWKDSPAVASFAICCLFAILMTFATIYDIWKRHIQSPSQFAHSHMQNSTYPEISPDASSISSRNDEITDEIIPNKNGSAEPINEEEIHVYNKSTHSALDIAGEVLLSFSIYTNGAKILSMSRGKESLGALNGMRFFSMTWIIMGHTFLVGSSYLDNSRVVLDVAKTFFFQIVAQGLFAVDTFFVLSGLLVTYLYLREYDRTNGKISWLKFYLHRLWRLTPPYMLILFLINVNLSKYFSSGPFWPKGSFEGHNCNKNWWWNALYINNFLSIADMCMGYTWYLANDMQFHILSPLILIPLGKRAFPLASIFAGGFLLTSWICSGVISSVHKLPAYFDLEKAAPGSEQYLDLFNYIYDKPYCRIGPYVIGMICGWVLYRTNCKMEIKKQWVVLGWLAAAACNLSILSGLYHAHFSQAISSLYFALARTAWSIGLCWVIFACSSGYGGIVNKILSWPVWNPCSRLTYMAYLWHYIVIQSVFASAEIPAHFSYTFFIYYYLANVIASYLGALLLSLAFESPFLALEKVLFRIIR